MEGKLIKDREHYYLTVDGKVFAEIGGHPLKSINKPLSLKNCEAIANGYDLIKLIEENSKYSEEDWGDGFLFAMNLMSDKKFTEKELTMLFAYGHQIGMNDVLAIQSQHSPQPMPKSDSDKLRDELIQSLQKTEWDVEIEMICPHPMDTYRCGLQYGCDGDGCNHPEQVPYLDADGCLILKRI